MKVLNTKKSPIPDSPTDEDFEELRRMVKEILWDPDGFIVIKGTSVEIDIDGNIVSRKP